MRAFPSCKGEGKVKDLERRQRPAPVESITMVAMELGEMGKAEGIGKSLALEGYALWPQGRRRVST
jgi:hypothetical protein